MNDKVKKHSSIESQEKIDDESIDQTRRDLMKKYGALAAVTPIALTLAMHSKKALASDCTDCAP